MSKLEFTTQDFVHSDEPVITEDKAFGVAREGDDPSKLLFNGTIGTCVNDPANEECVWIQYGNGTVIDWNKDRCHVSSRKGKIKTFHGKFVDFEVINKRQVKIDYCVFDVSFLISHIEQSVRLNVIDEERKETFRKSRFDFSVGDDVKLIGHILPRDLKFFDRTRTLPELNSIGVIDSFDDYMTYVKFENGDLHAVPLYCLNHCLEKDLSFDCLKLRFKKLLDEGKTEISVSEALMMISLAKHDTLHNNEIF